MRRPLVVLSLLTQVFAIPVQAVPTASMHWGTCPIPSPEDRNRGPGSGKTQTVIITGTGLTGEVREVTLFLSYTAGGSVVPDAWRVDAAGCAKAALRHNLGPVSCPVLRDPFAPGFLEVEYQTYPPGGWTEAREILTYHAQFDPMKTNPATTYTLLQLDFDLSSAIEGVAADGCGCVERPLAFRLGTVAYRDGTNAEHTFQVAYDNCLHWNDPTNKLECPYACELAPGPCPFPYDSVCVATTPAALKSWGKMKASYR